MENARLAIASPGNLRLAINAIMALDGFFGTVHTERYDQGLTKEPSDDKWKDQLAQQNADYRLLRDCAYALKHGRLTKSKPRLVRRSDQIVTMPGAFDAAAFRNNAFQVQTVWIEAVDTDHRAGQVLQGVLQFARDCLSDLP